MVRVKAAPSLRGPMALRPHVLLATLLMLGATLAGCAETSTDHDGGDHGSGAATPTGTASPSAGGTPRPTATPDGPHGDGHDDGSEGTAGEPWHAFAFAQEVRTRSGETGRITSYAYRSTEDQHGQRKVLDVRATIGGTVTEDVRVQRMDFSSGSYEPETISVPLTMHKVTHVVTVVEDSTGDTQAGETSTVTVYLPADKVAQQGSFAWFFPKLAHEGADGSGTWEYYLTPEMQKEMEAGTVTYLPYTGGDDASAWWGFNVMAYTYGLGMFSGWATGAQEFEEGSWSHGGVSYSVDGRTFDVGEHSFGGWRVETTYASGGHSGENVLEVAPDLPVPISYSIAAHTEDGHTLFAYELTDITLG